MKTFNDRFQHLIDVVGGNKKAARIMGKSDKSVERYKKDGAENVGIEDVAKLVNAAGKSIGWLLTGEDVGPLPETTSASLFVGIPVMSVTASAGGGAALRHEDVKEVFPVSRQWLVKMGLNASDLFMVEGGGDSMTPTILHAEKLICSRAEHDLNGDGIFVFRQDDDILLKRLQRVPGKIRVISDNESYTPYDIPLNDGVSFKIIGRVRFKLSLTPV